MFRDAHRAPTEGMVKAEAPDPRAARKKAQKARKEARRQLRHAIRENGIIGAAHLFLDARAAGYRELPPAEDCPACLKLQGMGRAA